MQSVRGVNIAAGAVVAMAVVLVAAGPGTLFPIALAIGAAVAAIQRGRRRADRMERAEVYAPGVEVRTARAVRADTARP